ncbi:MAG: hypothetical protein OXR68_07065, partial [Alphaproteobacteria bacterium]|nr:hypothetical protein [Alphaproteobacteria bacterium]
IYGTYTLLHDGKLPCFEFELVSNSPYLKKYTLYKALEDSWYWLKQDFSGVAKLIQHEPISILGTNKKFYFATFTGKVKLEELGIIAATHEFDLKLIRVEQLISETKSSDLCLSCIASALYNEHVGDLSLRDINFTRVGLIFRLCARTTLYLSNFVMSIVRKTPWLR